MWVYFTGSSSTQTFFTVNSATPTPTPQGFSFILSGGKFAFQHSTTHLSPQSAAVNGWHLVGMSAAWDETNVKYVVSFFEDTSSKGSAQQTSTVSVIDSVGSAHKLGCNTAGSSNYTGFIYHVRLYNKTLTLGDVSGVHSTNGCAS
jgi:hypothetical protein